MKKKTFLIALIVTIFLISCDKEIQRQPRSLNQNYIEINGVKTELSNGSFELIGTASNYDDSIVEIRLVSKGVELFLNEETNNQDYSGIGLMIVFSTSSESGSVLENHYTFSETDHISRGTFSGMYAEDFDFDELSGEVYNLIGGDIEIEMVGEEHIISFNCQNEMEESVKGYYKGALSYYVMNGN